MKRASILLLAILTITGGLCNSVFSQTPQPTPKKSSCFPCNPTSKKSPSNETVKPKPTPESTNYIGPSRKDTQVSAGGNSLNGEIKPDKTEPDTIENNPEEKVKVNIEPTVVTTTNDNNENKEPNGTSSANNLTALANENAKRSRISNKPLTEYYRVGVGDVLDIRILNANTKNSTLFSVTEGGLLDFPLAGEPMMVAGLTVEEIDDWLTERVKLYENPEISVSVRDFASHRFDIIGAVERPGAKALRREALPLYVVLAEAIPHNNANRAIITRAADRQNVTVSLDNTQEINNTLIYTGDVVRVAVVDTSIKSATQYFFIGGNIKEAGLKNFLPGLTLTQAVLMAGGVTKGNKAKVSRTNTDGKLMTIEYNLKQIKEGKIADPVLQAGDRIEIEN
jgi:polysaccharide export outer membrane protein